MAKPPRRVIDYDNRVFRAVANSANGESGAETLFYYRQAADIVWADYSGGGNLLIAANVLTYRGLFFLDHVDA